MSILLKGIPLGLLLVVPLRNFIKNQVGPISTELVVLIVPIIQWIVIGNTMPVCGARLDIRFGHSSITVRSMMCY